MLRAQSLPELGEIRCCFIQHVADGWTLLQRAPTKFSRRRYHQLLTSCEEKPSAPSTRRETNLLENTIEMPMPELHLAAL